MNYSIIFKMLSLVLGIMAFAFTACAAVSLYYAEIPLEAEAMPSWICVIAFSFLMAFAFYLPSRNAPGKLYRKEAICIVGLTWLLASLVGSLPYILILDCPVYDAVFESTSGITTTGASVFGDFSQIPHSLMFWRCLSHWIGGAGVVVFFVAVLSFLGPGAKFLMATETNSGSATSAGLETDRIQSGALRILGLYVSVSALCLTVFKLCGMGWFDGVCHMFSTVATGGFSVYENSIAHYNSALIDWAVIVFMAIGGISFVTLLYFVRGKFQKIRQNTELWTYIALLFVISTLISFLIIKSATSFDAWGDAVTQAVFHTVSIMTTTGFSTADYQTWTPSTHSILFVAMIIGGCAGSTSGGLKVWRAIACFKIGKRNIEKSFRPYVVRNIRLNGRNIDDESALDISNYVVLYAMTAVFCFMVLSVLEPNLSFSGCISSVMSLMSNVGPGFNETGPAENFGFMGGGAKLFLSLLMVMGRLELFAILVLFMPSLWKKFQ